MAKRIGSCLSAVLLLFSIFPCQAMGVGTSAASAILMDAESGRVLYEQNADREMLIASTTKIMTALVVLEHCALQDEVEILPEYTQVEGSSIYLRPGETVTVEELLYGLLLESGNDAAVALACHTSGSVEAFAQLMNQKAEELQLQNSAFVNPHGLDAEGHYASAYDLACIMAAAMSRQDFCDIVARKSAAVGNRTFTNHNRLLGSCDGVVGGKTGYTQSAGRSLVSCAVRNEMTLICVTLNDRSDWEDHAALYDWGFASAQFAEPTDGCSWEIPVISGQKACVQVSPAKSVHLLLSPADTVSLQINLPRFVYAQVRSGDRAGTLTCSVNGAPIETVDLIYTETVDQCVPPQPGFFARLQQKWVITMDRLLNRFGIYEYMEE